MDTNKVSVKIYGQEYTIAGEKSKEHIVNVANHVDFKIHELSQVLKGVPVASLAVLSAVNVADEYFETLEALEEEKRLTERLQQDMQHYIRLWEEAKKNFVHHQEETKEAFKRLEALTMELNAKNDEIKSLKRELEQARAGAENLASAKIAEAEARCKEMENSFFDLQMENINLKSELDKLKRSGGEF